MAFFNDCRIGGYHSLNVDEVRNKKRAELDLLIVGFLCIKTVLVFAALNESKV